MPDTEPSTVSVVVPVYNEAENAAELVRQIGAAMDHSPRPWELIVVDDGSTDATLRVLHEVCAEAPHLRVLELQRNYGQTAAMQAGIDASRGDLVVMQSLHVGRNECERLSEQSQFLARQQANLDLELQRMKSQYQNEYSREQAIQKLLEQRKNKQRCERLKQEQHQLDELAAVRDRNLSGT